MPVISSVVNAVLLVIAGVILANILAETGIFSRLSSFTGPLCRFSGLSDACVLSIVAMGVNATAGKSMLAEYYRDGKVTEREVIPVLIMGAFPVVLGEPPGRCIVDPWRACCRCEGGDGGHGSTEHIIVVVFALDTLFRGGVQSRCHQRIREIGRDGVL